MRRATSLGTDISSVLAEAAGNTSLFDPSDEASLAGLPVSCAGVALPPAWPPRDDDDGDDGESENDDDALGRLELSVDELLFPKNTGAAGKAGTIVS